MTDQDFKQLETLLAKLRQELGNRYAISPDYLLDGVHIATYDSESGLLLKQTIAATIKKAVKNVKDSK